MKSADWRADLEASRGLSAQQKRGFALILGWFETWRIRSQKMGNRAGARLFWKTEVLKKERDQW
jgi:hypothetical protein